MGKAKAAANGKIKQKGPHSVRQLWATVADVGAMIAMMGEMRHGVAAK